MGDLYDLEVESEWWSCRKTAYVTRVPAHDYSRCFRDISFRPIPSWEVCRSDPSALATTHPPCPEQTQISEYFSCYCSF